MIFHACACAWLQTDIRHSRNNLKMLINSTIHFALAIFVLALNIKPEEIYVRMSHVATLMMVNNFPVWHDFVNLLMHLNRHQYSIYTSSFFCIGQFCIYAHHLISIYFILGWHKTLNSFTCHALGLLFPSCRKCVETLKKVVFVHLQVFKSHKNLKTKE